MKIRQEVFAVGTWNGFPFTVNDLKKMAAAFNELKGNLKVPLKLGHNDEQKVTDGQPALGWVDSMSVDEDSKPAKLVAEFTDVPDIVREAMKKRLYRSVSIELDFDVEYKGTKHDFVVTAVALLGADLPAVNVLNDLAAYMSAQRPDASVYSAGQQVSFSVIKGSKQETDMDELQKALAEKARLEADLATTKAQFSALEAKSKAEVETLQAQFAALQADQRKRDVEGARAKFTAILEGAVKSKAITPAQRESFTTVLGIDDDDKVLELKEDAVKALFATAPKTGEEEHGMQGDGTGDDEVSADQRLVKKTHEYMAKNGEDDFTKAMFAVMRADERLASEYIMSNGEVQ